jgi:hypothetical protein
MSREEKTGRCRLRPNRLKCHSDFRMAPGTDHPLPKSSDLSAAPGAGWRWGRLLLFRLHSVRKFCRRCSFPANPGTPGPASDCLTASEQNAGGGTKLPLFGVGSPALGDGHDSCLLAGVRGKAHLRRAVAPARQDKVTAGPPRGQRRRRHRPVAFGGPGPSDPTCRISFRCSWPVQEKTHYINFFSCFSNRHLIILYLRAELQPKAFSRDGPDALTGFSLSP